MHTSRIQGEGWAVHKTFSLRNVLICIQWYKKYKQWYRIIEHFCRMVRNCRIIFLWFIKNILFCIFLHMVFNVMIRNFIKLFYVQNCYWITTTKIDHEVSLKWAKNTRNILFRSLPGHGRQRGSSATNFSIGGFSKYAKLKNTGNQTATHPAWILSNVLRMAIRLLMMTLNWINISYWVAIPFVLQ